MVTALSLAGIGSMPAMKLYSIQQTGHVLFPMNDFHIRCNGESRPGCRSDPSRQTQLPVRQFLSLHDKAVASLQRLWRDVFQQQDVPSRLVVACSYSVRLMCHQSVRLMYICASNMFCGRKGLRAPSKSCRKVLRRLCSKSGP